MRTQLFAPLDAMTVRHKFGTVVDRTNRQRDRFIITRRGKDLAILLPISDRKLVESALKEQSLRESYEALDSIKGMVTNRHLTNASETVDDYVYGFKKDDDK